ncbi:hypothetical protein D0Y65_004247, partial [Glycine soja]
KLFQQFVVEGYTMVESERLSFIRNNQKKLRVDKFCSLQQSLDAGATKGLQKGYDRVIVVIVHDDNDAIYHATTQNDEIKEYLDCSNQSFPEGRTLTYAEFVCTMNKPEEVWDQTWHWLADDIVYHHRKTTTNTEIHLNDDHLKILVLLEIEQLLQANQKSLRDYPSMSYPEDGNWPSCLDNSLILLELNYNTDEVRLKFLYLFSKMTGNIFGGKVMVLGGDFRQILPVIPRGSRSDIVHATINSSYLWDYCQILTLTKNMRLQSNIQVADKEETATFAQWILDIGDGIIGHPNDAYAKVEIPQDLLITKYDDPIHGIVNSTFPNLCQHHNNPEFFQSRGILASTNETVQQVNDYILSLIPELPTMY